MNEPQRLSFADQAAWQQWLDQNQALTEGIWLKIAKKSSHIPSISYDQAVETALCYGWIDGQKKALDDKYWLQRFTPRRSRSVWSKINTERAERLIAEGKMHPAGLAEVQKAKVDGRWETAYHPQSRAEVPADFQQALDSNPVAKQFFTSLNSTNRYAMLYRIQEAKRPETRAARIEKFISMLERGEALYLL